MKSTMIKVLITLVLIYNMLSAQSGKGTISGTVVDKSSNEKLIGATVQIVGTNKGASTDIDGIFKIKNLDKGVYDIKISYISYNSTTIQGIVVDSDNPVKLTIMLELSTVQVKEQVVSVDALKNNENEILRGQKNSLSIIEGLSAELISKNSSSDGTDVMRTMTGVTIADGKYAYIRGIGDRYNNTLLNGAALPSTDPEKRSFSFDIFPASLIENLITAKTFTPDKPGDFSGGLVQIQTLEFPQKFFIDLNTTSGFNSENNLTEFSTYNTGKKDFLGTDDGTRSLPSQINDTKVTKGFYSNSQLEEIGKSFKNNWEIKNANSPLNTSIKLSLGDRYYFDENTLGIVASLSYSNSYDIKNMEKSSYVFEGPRYKFKGENYVNSVIWGGLLNLSYKFNGINKISFKNIYNQTSDDEVTNYTGNNFSYGQYRNSTELKFVSRNLFSSQFLGEHHFEIFNGVKLEWNLSYAHSNRSEPDARRYIYSRDENEPNDPMRLLLDPSLTTRLFSNLDDRNFGGNINFSIKLFDDAALPAIKAGILYDKKEREFSARMFGFKNNPGGDFVKEDLILQGKIEDIFNNKNFNPGFIEVSEITKPSDSYNSSQNIFSSYIMTDAELFSKIKIIAGLRFEKSGQKLNSFTQTGEHLEKNPIYDDLLPSLNVTYNLNEIINLRFAATQTLARPEFRELAPYSYYDFTSAELVLGNENLKRARISNYDFRFELYPEAGEIIAVSMFYKYFNSPIEQVLISASGIEPIRSYQNADKAYNYGLEFEVRKNLDFIIEELINFQFISNLSLVRSKVELDPVKNNGFQVSERPLQGQSNYIINLGIYYEDYKSGLTSSLTYNRVGERISKVGFAGLGDIIELPRDQVDFSISQKILNSLRIKFTAKDILAQENKYLQRTSYAGDLTSELQKNSSTYSIGLSFQF